MWGPAVALAGVVHLQTVLISWQDFLSGNQEPRTRIILDIDSPFGVRGFCIEIGDAMTAVAKFQM